MSGLRSHCLAIICLVAQGEAAASTVSINHGAGGALEHSLVLDAGGRVAVMALDGRVVWAAQGEPFAPVRWAGRAVDGTALPAGVYLATGGGAEALRADSPWSRCEPDPCLGPGEPGRFDAQDVYAPTLLQEGDTLKVWYAAFDGTEAGPTTIGFARSLDQGATWDRSEEPALLPGPTGGFDQDGVGAPYVMRDRTGALVLYYAGFRGDIASGTYRIGRAVSVDGGRSWSRSPSLAVFSGDTSWSDMALYKAVLPEGDGYTMWFVGIALDAERPWKVGRATSPDGLLWSAAPSAPVLTGVDAWNDYGLPTLDVDRVGQEFVMWVSGTRGDSLRIGRATSADGLTWELDPENPQLSLGGGGAWDERDVNEPSALYQGSVLRLFHSGRDSTLVNAVGCKFQAVGIGEAPEPRADESRLEASPNPFNPHTTIRFQVEHPGRARLAIHDVSGALIRVLVDETLGGGSHAVIWDGTGDRGQTVPNGVYLALLEADGGRHARRLVMVK